MTRDGWDPGPRPKGDITELAGGKELRREVEDLLYKIRSAALPPTITDRDREFIDSMQEQVTSGEDFIPSRKQVFWLRDIWAKFS